MNVNQISDRIKRQFGDESGVQVTDADILRWINDGQRQIVMQNETLLEKTSTADSVANQQSYTLPVDLLILKGIQYKGSNETQYFPLKGYSLSEFNEAIRGWDEATVQSTGTPFCYTVYSNEIKLFPIPNASITAALKIYYNRIPTDVTLGTDAPDLPFLYHEMIVNYCLQQAYEMDEDWDASNNKAGQLSDGLAILRGREDWKNQEHYPMITILDGDDW